MTLKEAIKIKLQWRKDNYPPALADEMNADKLSIEAITYCQNCPYFEYQAKDELPPGETEN